MLKTPEQPLPNQSTGVTNTVSWTTKTFLQLGRVSSLPTILSTTLAGAALAGGNPLNPNIVILMFAMSLAYIGGAFLNDAFDRKFDKEHHPERPISKGTIKAAEVFAAGFTLLAASVMFSALGAMSWGHNVAIVILLTIALTITIVLYDIWHKDNPLSPVIMGLCRFLLILIAGFAAADKPSVVLYFGAAAMLCYLIGLTWAARQENFDNIKNLWPLLFLLIPVAYGLVRSLSDFQVLPLLLLLTACTLYAIVLLKRKQQSNTKQAKAFMIAGIALVDALLISTSSSLFIAAIAVTAFLLTLTLQHYLADT